MRAHVIGLLALAILGAGAAPVRADDDENTRLREMLHRTQEALRQAQSDNADLTKAKVDAEQKAQDTGKQLDAVRTTSKSAQSSNAALQAKLDGAQTTQTNLHHGLDDANAHLAAANARIGDLTRQLAAQEADLKGAKQSLEQSHASNASCEHKNLVLYRYSTEILQRYKNKGVWASMSQKEPVFGFEEVDVENTVQEYQLKLNDEKLPPPGGPSKP